MIDDVGCCLPGVVTKDEALSVFHHANVGLHRDENRSSLTFHEWIDALAMVAGYIAGCERKSVAERLDVVTTYIKVLRFYYLKKQK